MTDVLKPRDAHDVAAAIQWALGQSKPLDVVGAGSKRELGRPTQTDATLDLSGLTGVTLYEPEELVLSARAGTRMSPRERSVILVHCFAAWAYAWASPSVAAGELEEKGVVYRALPHPRWLELTALAALNEL